MLHYIHKVKSRFFIRYILLYCSLSIGPLFATPSSTAPYIVQMDTLMQKKQIFDGSIQPLNIYELTAPYESVLVKSFANLGETILQDTVVFELQSTALNEAIFIAQENMAQAEKRLHLLKNWSYSSESVQARMNRNQAKMSYKNAKSHYKNSQKLLAKGIISQEECHNDKVRLFQAKKNYIEQKQIYLKLANKADEQEINQLQQKIAQEKTRLEVLQDKFSSLQIKSPITGILLPEKSEQNASELNWGLNFKKSVKLDEVIARVADISTFAITLRMNESDVLSLQGEHEVNVTLNAYPNLKLDAQILEIRHSLQPSAERYIAPKFDVVIAARMPALNHSNILFGMSTKIEVAKQIDTKGVVIPKALIQYENNKPFCWVGRDSGINRQSIKVGSVSNQQVEVVSGLSAGDLLYTHA